MTRQIDNAYRAQVRARQKERRRESSDTSVPQKGSARAERTELGLALLSLAGKPGIEYSCGEIAAWCGCTEEAIRKIESRALEKLQRLARTASDEHPLRECFREVFRK